MENAKVAVKPQSKARLAILELAHMMSVPLSLVAVLNMKVPDAIWQGGNNTPLSCFKILSILGLKDGGDAENLQRLLRLLTTYNIFDESLSSNGERKYSLTDVGKTLVADDDGLSYASYMLQHHQVYSINYEIVTYFLVKIMILYLCLGCFDASMADDE